MSTKYLVVVEIYHNYHKHDHYGNPWAKDVVVKAEEYCKRAVELGHTTVFTVNHGVTGNIFDWLAESEKYGLKMCYGTEAYFVKNRFEKDKTNKHIVIVAKNNDGVMQLNDIMTEAHSTGFYYKPRIDVDLLMSLNPNDFIITTACVAGIWNDTELILSLNRRFPNFFLEVQNHNMSLQKEVNKKMIELGKEMHIPLIHANDSHYIYPDDSKYRDIFLKGKDMFYDNEDEMILDYPDEDYIYERYGNQGVLTRSQVKESLENTRIFDECEKITLINTDIKLPEISQTPNQDLRNILLQQWKAERNKIPKEKQTKYIDSIKYELDIIEKTNMANYFLIDYNVVKDAKEKYGGILTKTGRGSAPSFYTTKLLGLTDIDRVSAPVTLFPTRFMSVERILNTRSLPDIDLNTSDREPFIKATEDLLGAENCAWMLAWKPLQASSAFRTYCKGIGLDVSEYDEIAKNLDNYKEDKKWKPIIEESKRFVGVVESVAESPCSLLLYDKPVRKELGLVRTSKGKLCCLLDGYNCDKYKYLKNDYLTVTVWAIIRDVCNFANIPIPTIDELNELLDDKTFDIYKDGLTCTINQADSDYATGLAKAYCPRSVSEMSAFVAIIRPGCASLLQDFISRKPYTTGVQELDNLLIDGSHRMIYQELIMKYLIWLGIPEAGSYDIIKKIAKKKFKEAELEELKKKLKSGWLEKVGSDEGFLETWTIVEQAAKYSFNASHSLSYAYDSLYGAYLKSHYPLEYYTVALNYYIGDEERTNKLIDELPKFGLKLKPIKFRFSTDKYNCDKETNEIYKGIESIKYLNSDVANEMYELRDNYYNSFVDLLYDLKEKTSLNSRQISILIDLDFFEEFGNVNYLKRVYQLFGRLGDVKQLKKEKLKELGVDEAQARKYAGKETEKMLTQINAKGLLGEIVKGIHAPKRKLSERISAQIEHLGYIDIADKQYDRMAVVVSLDKKYSPKLKMYSLKNGRTMDCKIQKKIFNRNKLSKGDIVVVLSTNYKPKSKKNDKGEWEPVPGTKELWLTGYRKLYDI